MRPNSEKGFSLLELMVAALLTVGLMGGIFALASRNQQVFVTESGVTDMNQNVRTAIDLVTRDVQSAGMGLPAGVGNFAALYYKNGATGAPDSILMLNGDPSAPVATVDTRAAGSAEIFLLPPQDVTQTGTGSTIQFSYTSYDKRTKPIYRDYSSDPRMYLIYDDTRGIIFPLKMNGVMTGVGPGERLKLSYDANKYQNPASLFGTAIGLGEPDYANANVALIQSTVAYRLDTNTNELLRSEDLQTWYSVARGILNFQVQYRVLRRTGEVIEEKVTDSPGDGTDSMPSGELSSRRDIHSLVITIVAETPDVPPNNPSYRRVTHKFEVTPRNLNLVNNNNIRNIKSE